MGRWRFWIDRGGTFTDVIARRPDGQMAVRKLLSRNPEKYADAALQGIRDFLGMGSTESIPGEQIEEVRLGTNALLERRGERVVFVTTRGFADMLRIGYQNRPDIFARRIVLPDMLYQSVLEADERLDARGKF